MGGQVGTVGILVVDPQEDGSVPLRMEPGEGALGGVPGDALEDIVAIRFRLEQFPVKDVEAAIEARARLQHHVANERARGIARGLEAFSQG